MLSIIKSMSLIGINGYIINVQVDISAGLPYWQIVGLPDTSIREAKERVKTAIKNSKFELPSRKVIINLEPTGIKKEGPIFDLPIAILYNLGYIKKQNIENILFIGTLSLDGKITKIDKALPICIEAQKQGIRNIVLPYDNLKETNIINGIQIIGVKNLIELVEYLNNERELQEEKTKIEEILKNDETYKEDFSEIRGQENVKRALEISAAGAHNCLLIGCPRFRKNSTFKKNTNNFAKLNI